MAQALTTHKDLTLIDVFQVEDTIKVWCFDPSGKNLFFDALFNPPVYVSAKINELQRLQETLKGYAISSAFEDRKTFLGVKTVLKIGTSLGSRPGLIRDIEKTGKYHFELCDVDVPIEEHFIFERDLFATGIVDVEAQGSRIINITAKDSPTSEYTIPSLKISDLSIETDKPIRQGNARLTKILFDGIEFPIPKSKSITKFIEAFERSDPDIILTQDGNLELPFLLGTANRFYPSFSFSRFGVDRFAGKGRSYVSYGRTIFKQDGVRLKGRLHLQQKGAMYGQWSIDQPMELARLCKTTIQRANHRSPGYCISNLQTYHAMKKGFLIGRTQALVERWKSGMDIFNADRGAMVYEPRIGFHKDIAELDFVSLFPSIMVKRNISTETLFCRCCQNNRVPNLNINICQRDKGIIPAMLEPIISQRIIYKSMFKQTANPVYNRRADALKGLLVTCFGYMGFRKSRLSRIEAHQSILAYAREILLQAAKIAEELGFSVIHGIVDSLWVKKKGLDDPSSGARKDLDLLITEIKARTDFDIKLEGVYRWIVFLPSTNDPQMPVATRYYGVFEDGAIKLRGIEARKHDTPKFISLLQTAFVEELAKSSSREEFMSAAWVARANARASIRDWSLSNMDPGLLAVQKRISKTDYKASLAQAIVIGKLRADGFDPQPGHVIKYIISKKDSSIPNQRYIPLSRASFDGALPIFDRAEYSRLAYKAIDDLIAPFEEELQEVRQSRLSEFGKQQSQNENTGVAETFSRRKKELVNLPFLSFINSTKNNGFGE